MAVQGTTCESEQREKRASLMSTWIFLDLMPSVNFLLLNYDQAQKLSSLSQLTEAGFLDLLSDHFTVIANLQGGP